MSKLSTDDVMNLARLSSIELTDEEAVSLRGDIQEILGYVEQLSDLDTSGVEPTYQVTGLQNVFRADTVSDSNVSGLQLVAMAAETTEDQVKVPKVL